MQRHSTRCLRVTGAVGVKRRESNRVHEVGRGKAEVEVNNEGERMQGRWMGLDQHGQHKASAHLVHCLHK